jgi:uncharacterized protein YbjT (DUF2867 family)
MMATRALIVGASGTVGGAVAAAAARRGLPFVVGARGGVGAGWPAVALDLERPETFAGALDGVDRVFLIAPGFREDADQLMAPFIAAMAAAGVGAVVFSSVIGAEYNPAGPHRKIELALEAAGLRSTLLRPNFYMENFLTYEVENVLGQGVIPLPTGEGRASYVDVLDIAEVAAAVLADPAAHAGQAYTLTGPAALSHGEIAGLLSAALGGPVVFTDPSPADHRAAMVAGGVPEGIIAQSEALYALIRDNVCAGVSGDVARVLGREATPFAAWAARRAVPALQARRGCALPTPAELISRANALMTLWEYGDRAGYGALCAPHVRMSIPEYGLDVTGFGPLWAVRTGIRAVDAGPLHIHTLDTHVVDGLEVRGQAHVIHRTEGRFTQHGQVRFCFDQGGRLVHYHQVNTWMG